MSLSPFCRTNRIVFAWEPRITFEGSCAAKPAELRLGVRRRKIARRLEINRIPLNSEWTFYKKQMPQSLETIIHQ